MTNYYSYHVEFIKEGKSGIMKVISDTTSKVYKFLKSNHPHLEISSVRRSKHYVYLAIESGEIE